MVRNCSRFFQPSPRRPIAGLSRRASSDAVTVVIAAFERRRSLRFDARFLGHLAPFVVVLLDQLGELLLGQAHHS
jgi:hypothetical protein